MGLPSRTAPFVLLVVSVLAAGCGDGSGPADKAGKPASAAPSAAATTPPATPNGIERLTTTEILAKARKATSAASTLHMFGRSMEDGEPTTVDYLIGRQAARARISTGRSTVEMVRIGTKFYTKGNREYWNELNEPMTAKYADKYVEFTPGEVMYGPLMRQLTIPALVEEDPEAKGKPPVRGTIEQIGGRRTISLVVDYEKIYVALDGEPRFLRTSTSTGDHVDYVYDVPVTVAPPPEDQILHSEPRTPPS